MYKLWYWDATFQDPSNPTGPEVHPILLARLHRHPAWGPSLAGIALNSYGSCGGSPMILSGHFEDGWHIAHVLLSVGTRVTLTQTANARLTVKCTDY